jgi:uncharacterized membrane protein
MRASVTTACVLVLAVAGPREAGATDYTIRDLHPVGYKASGLYALDAGQFAGYAKGVPTSGSTHAFLWDDSTGTTVDLNPAGYAHSQVNGVSSSVQVGECYGLADGRAHAFLWLGSTSSAVDLHPAGCLDSTAKAVADGEQVGSATLPGQGYHAALWRGSAASFVDLHPSGYTSSHACAIAGGHVAGYAMATTDGWAHALLWNGSATEYVDLHPAGYGWSEAAGIADGQEVGFAHMLADWSQHALLWTGSASSVVDLHPLSGFSNSVAEGVSNGLQVGGGWGPVTGDYEHALLWRGSAESVVDLHGWLGSGYSSSYAYAIDANGNIAGRARDLAGNSHAIVWVPVPEPATLSLLTLGALLLARRRWV